MKRTIAIIGCGGTVSTIARNGLDFIEYPETGRKMEPAEVVAGMGDLLSFVDIECIAFRAVGSSAIGPAEWIELAHRIDELAARRADIHGVLILHGTGSLEETAYFLDLALACNLPVALTGSQRPYNAVSSDAQMNILSAIRALTDERLAGCGVMVVMNDEIHQARDVTKTSTYRLNAFRSPDCGPLAVVDGDVIEIMRRPARPHMGQTPFSAPMDVADLARVDIAYAYAGADGVVVDAFVAAGAAGIISAGFAPGIPPRSQRASLERAAAAGVVVVQASRSGAGRVGHRSYLEDHGFIAAGDLNPQKARVLLMLALRLTRDPRALQEFFDEF